MAAMMGGPQLGMLIPQGMKLTKPSDVKLQEQKALEEEKRQEEERKKIEA
jgi:hypothetical protein